MDDMISRQLAIDFIDAGRLGNPNEPRWSDNEVVNFLKRLPSVQPERNTGKWNFIGDQMFECTKCGTCYTQNQFHQMRVRITDSEFPKFCPNCGCQMERSTE